VELLNLGRQVLDEKDQIGSLEVLLHDLEQVRSRLQRIVQTVHVCLHQAQRKHTEEGFRTHHLKERANTLIPANVVELSNLKLCDNK